MGISFCISMIGSISLIGLGIHGMINQDSNHWMHILFIIGGTAFFIQQMREWKKEK